MATSGTISQTVFTTRQVIDHAFRRCGLHAQIITGEMIDIARDVLYLMFSDWANNNIQLWCIDKVILPMYEAQAQLPMPLGTVDILNANIRQVFYVDGTVTQTPTSYAIQFTAPIQISTIGMIWSQAAVPITIQNSNDGITWSTLLTVTPTSTAGQRYWVDIDGVVAAPYYRITAASTLNISNVKWGHQPTEITIARLNRDDYINLPNKTFQGRPLQYWYDRQRDIHIMTLWPAPNAYYANEQQLTVWRKRYIMDVGGSQETLDIPQRWYEAVIANLANRVAGEIPQVTPDRLPILEAKANLALMKAQSEERDNSPIYWSPNIGVYTR